MSTVPVGLVNSSLNSQWHVPQPEVKALEDKRGRRGAGRQDRIAEQVATVGADAAGVHNGVGNSVRAFGCFCRLLSSALV